MKTLQLFFFATWLLFFVQPNSTLIASGKNRNERPAQVHAIQSLGPGISIGLHLRPEFYFGIEHYSMSDEGKIMDLNLDYQFTTNQLMGRYFPWKEYGFCIQLGIVSRDWKVTGTTESYIGNDTTKRVATIEIIWPETVLGYGIGWYIVSKFGLSGGFGVGYITGNAPEIRVTAVGASASDIALEEQEAAETFKEYQTFPYTNLSIGWSF